MNTGKKRKKTYKLSKEIIMDNAMKLFIKKGYFSTTVRDIARETDASTGAIYNYFKTKVEIATELFETTADFISGCFKKAIEKGETTKDKIYNIVESVFYLADNHRDKLEYALYVKHKEILPDGKSICSSAPFNLLKDFLVLEMKNGNLKDMDVNLAIVCLTGIPVRLIVLKWDGIIEREISDYKSDVFKIIWNTLRN